MATTTLYTVFDGEVISENRNGVSKFYVPDPLGSTRALLDNTQTQTDTFNYWPYGEVQSRTGTTPTPLQFVGTRGYYKDNPTSTTGRCYVRARYMDLAKGRWITQDPIGFDSGENNFYRYTGNNPVTQIDPYGLTPPDFGDSLCRRLHGAGWHHCSGHQWNLCLAKCKIGQAPAINNVKYCCAKSDHGNGDCQCIKPPQKPKPRPGTGPDYPPNNPNSGWGCPPPPKPPDIWGPEGPPPWIMINPDDPFHKHDPVLPPKPGPPDAPWPFPGPVSNPFLD